MNNKTTTPKASAPETRAHSPVPWKIINGAIFDSAGRLVYASEEENGKIIVASVNHADKLAEDLRAIVDSPRNEKNAIDLLARVEKALAAYEASRQ